MPTPSESQILEIIGALRRAAELAVELDAELTRRVQVLDSLRSRIAAQERVAALGLEDARETTLLLGVVIDVYLAQARWASRREQVLFFILGVVVSVPMQMLADWLIR